MELKENKISLRVLVLVCFNNLETSVWVLFLTEEEIENLTNVFKIRPETRLINCYSSATRIPLFYMDELWGWHDILFVPPHDSVYTPDCIQCI
jgi:hypothetical protein